MGVEEMYRRDAGNMRRRFVTGTWVHLLWGGEEQNRLIQAKPADAEIAVDSPAALFSQPLDTER
jgi:hypothetical protein